MSFPCLARAAFNRVAYKPHSDAYHTCSINDVLIIAGIVENEYVVIIDGQFYRMISVFCNGRFGSTEDCMRLDGLEIIR